MYKHMILLVMIMSLSFAAIWVSGDNGEKFAEEKAIEMCKQSGVTAVYICNGNVVRVVDSEGSTFYKPDGKVVECPKDAAPSQIGAECLQMMIPNYCPKVEQCGESDVTTVFPGQNTTVQNNTQPPVTPNQTNQTVNQTPQQNVTPVNNSPEPEVPNTPVIKTGTETPLNYLLPVVLLLGIAAIIILFMLFKNSIHNDA